MGSDKLQFMERLNNSLIHCHNCRLAETRMHVLRGEGNVNAQMFFVALSPGTTEDQQNCMFIGPSGKILNTLFDAAGIDRYSIYMTNLIKCMLPKNRRPKLNEIEACFPFLINEITIVEPDIIIPLGYYATRSVFEYFDFDAPSARVDYRPLYGELVFSGHQKIFPLPHPASLIYRPDYFAATREKYKKLEVFLKECRWFRVCPMKRFYESGQLDEKWIALYCQGDWSRCVRYQMEKKGEYHPDWMLPDGSLAEQLK